MHNINIDGVIKASETLYGRIIKIEGTKHGAARIFNQCMRAFDRQLGAEAITFSVYLNAPIMAAGFATIHKDGRLEMRTAGEV